MDRLDIPTFSRFVIPPVGPSSPARRKHHYSLPCLRAPAAAYPRPRDPWAILHTSVDPLKASASFAPHCLSQVVPMAVMSGALLAVAVLSGAPALVLCVFVAGFVVNASCALLNLSTLGFTVRLADVLAGYRMASLALPEEGLPLLHYAVLVRPALQR